MEIIPTILSKTSEEAEQKIRVVEKQSEWIQIDAMDGIFVNNETFPYNGNYKENISKLKTLKIRSNIEAHLMVNKPEEIINDWLEIADRIFIHFESRITNRELGINTIIEKAHKQKKQIGLAINPETDVAATMPFLKNLDAVLCMTVQPGWGGQEFKPWVLKKIKYLKKIWPNGITAVDGGVNNKNIKRIKKAGTDIAYIGTHIFNSKNPEKRLKKLKRK
ncbi:MAG: ribulose-phosphate 3-epimerase [Candidatus Portnoybacteria bacterium]|nr:ribulose-phosphate 3-epimerase [Candidatus Portnoybacteria bacterium]